MTRTLATIFRVEKVLPMSRVRRAVKVQDKQVKSYTTTSVKSPSRKKLDPWMLMIC